MSYCIGHCIYLFCYSLCCIKKAYEVCETDDEIPDQWCGILNTILISVSLVGIQTILGFVFIWHYFETASRCICLKYLLLTSSMWLLYSGTSYTESSHQDLAKFWYHFGFACCLAFWKNKVFQYFTNFFNPWLELRQE